MWVLTLTLPFSLGHPSAANVWKAIVFYLGECFQWNAQNCLRWSDGLYENKWKEDISFSFDSYKTKKFSKTIYIIYYLLYFLNVEQSLCLTDVTVSSIR